MERKVKLLLWHEFLSAEQYSLTTYYIFRVKQLSKQEEVVWGQALRFYPLTLAFA